MGNAYVNRAITGAIVQRQPFGGWKQSNVGPGAKAGGPNYVMQLGSWTNGTSDAGDSLESDEHWWATEFSQNHDPTGLFCEANIFRYRPLDHVVVRVGPDATKAELDRVLAAAAVCGVATSVSLAVEEPDEAFAERLSAIGVQRVRALGTVSDAIRVAAAKAHVHVADGPVIANGRIELLHFLREQAISRTLHRFGNLVAVDN